MQQVRKHLKSLVIEKNCTFFAAWPKQGTARMIVKSVVQFCMAVVTLFWVLIIITRKWVHGLPHELPNYVRLTILGNYEIKKIAEMLGIDSEHATSHPREKSWQMTQYQPPVSDEETTFSPKFWKGQNKKKMNAWGDFKSSCHRVLPGMAYYVSCQRRLSSLWWTNLGHFPIQA